MIQTSESNHTSPRNGEGPFLPTFVPSSFSKQSSSCGLPFRRSPFGRKSNGFHSGGSLMGRELVTRSGSRGYSHLDQVPEEVLLQKSLPQLRHQLRLIDLGDLVGPALLVQTATEGNREELPNDGHRRRNEKICQIIAAVKTTQAYGLAPNVHALSIEEPFARGDRSDL
jgi:hypothetical protein